MKRYMRNKDVKRSEMSGGGGCSLGSVPSVFTCTDATTAHPPTEASLDVPRLEFVGSPITYQRHGSTGALAGTPSSYCTGISGARAGLS